MPNKAITTPSDANTPFSCQLAPGLKENPCALVLHITYNRPESLVLAHLFSVLFQSHKFGSSDKAKQFSNSETLFYYTYADIIPDSVYQGPQYNRDCGVSDGVQQRTS